MPPRLHRPWSPLLPSAALALLCCREPAPTAPGDTGDPAAPSAVAVAAALPFVQVTQGITHSCGITTDDRAYCWGDNFLGQLGDGTTTMRLTPRAVAGGLRFRFVSAGWWYTCGLTTDDRAYCWGDNSSGTLGSGDENLVSSPVPVAVAGSRRYRQMRAGVHHACAVTLADVAFCWGQGSMGQLGVTLTGFQVAFAPVKVQTGGLVFRRVFASSSHTCALTAAGKAYCWGNNREGELGDGTRDTSVTPVPVSGSRVWSQLSPGLSHNCGVSEGKAYCWGTNLQGALGDGTQTERLVPTPVAGALSFKGLSASGGYTCGITTSDRAYCWGGNSSGQLGDGTFGNRNFRLVPTKVVGGLVFSAIGGMVVGAHTCAVTPENRAYCWGSNARGELGNNSQVKSPRPVAVQ